MKKLLLVAIVLMMLASIFTSCAKSKVIEIDNKQVLVEPYGVLNDQAIKNDSVIYQVSVGSVICSVIFCETLIVPIYTIGWDLYEPVKKK